MGKIKYIVILLVCYGLYKGYVAFTDFEIGVADRVTQLEEASDFERQGEVIALMMYLGVDGVFVGSGIFESSNPNKMAKGVCLATTYYNNYEKLIEASDMASNPMKGLDAKIIDIKYENR